MASCDCSAQRGPCVAWAFEPCTVAGEVVLQYPRNTDCAGLEEDEDLVDEFNDGADSCKYQRQWILQG